MATVSSVGLLLTASQMLEQNVQVEVLEESTVLLRPPAPAPVARAKLVKEPVAPAPEAGADSEIDVERATVLLSVSGAGSRPAARAATGVDDSDEGVDVQRSTVFLDAAAVRARSGEEATEDPCEDGENPRVLLRAVPTLRAPSGEGVPAWDDDLLGERIASYELVEIVGRGTFGTVYRARDPRLDRDVALKVCDPRIAQDSALVELFRREARIQAQLEHPNIMPVHDVLDVDGRLCIVMRLVEGEDLDAKLRSMRRPFTPGELMPVLRQVCDAVGAGHARGVLHMDLKPGNIRLTPAGWRSSSTSASPRSRDRAPCARTPPGARRPTCRRSRSVARRPMRGRTSTRWR